MNSCRVACRVELNQLSQIPCTYAVLTPALATKLFRSKATKAVGTASRCSVRTVRGCQGDGSCRLTRPLLDHAGWGGWLDMGVCVASRGGGRPRPHRSYCFLCPRK